MPIFFLLVGIMLIVTAINNKLPQLRDLLAEDFAPSNGAAGFHVWILALFVAGSLGYIKSFRPVANAFIVLILVGLVLSNGGFFDNFRSALGGKTK